MNTIIKIPRGIYKACKVTGRHEMTFYFHQANARQEPFTIGADSLKTLLKMVDEFFAPTDTPQRYESVSAYNRAYTAGLEDTQSIDLDLVETYQDAA